MINIDIKKRYNVHIVKMYKLVYWPEVQELMDRPGFEENSYPAVTDDVCIAYFVNIDWLND